MSELVGVLCARPRIEEKQLIAAFGAAGREAVVVSPVAEPAPLGPSPVQPPATTVAGGVAASLLIDRIQDRAVAPTALRARRLAGNSIVGAGIAATEDRASIAIALSRSGIARPRTFAVFDEVSALAAIDAVGYPATFLPLTPKAPELQMIDRDVAEAVMEHREMLRTKHDAVGLVQAGIVTASATLIVANGAVVGVDGDRAIADGRAFDLAIAAAVALAADLVGVTVAAIDGGCVVWDIDPVPDFRAAQATGELDIAAAIVAGIAANTGSVAPPSVLISAWEAKYDAVACG